LPRRYHAQTGSSGAAVFGPQGDLLKPPEHLDDLLEFARSPGICAGGWRS